MKKKIKQSNSSAILSEIKQAGLEVPETKPKRSLLGFWGKRKNKEKIQTNSPKTKSNRKKFLYGFLSVLLVLGILSAIAGLATYFPVKKIQALSADAEANGRAAYDALKHQDLVLANEKLSVTKANFEQIQSEYKKLAWYQFTPFRAYYMDGNRVLNSAKAGITSGEILLTTIEPYADVLGFSGEGTFTGGTAEERIVKIIETLDKVTPALDQVATELKTVQANLSEIDPARYPMTIKGRQVSEWIEMANYWTDAAVIAVTDVKPLLEVLPSVAGIDEEKKYLVLFQNDAEVRATGGFLTAYGVLRVEKGKVNQEKSDDIYSLDDKFRSNITPPDVISKYLEVNRWHIRDMNMSPDFKESMDFFMEHYKTLPDEPADQIDGIVAVDTQLLSDLIKVLGPTDVPGFGQFTAEIDPRCDCPQVIYELEDFATRPRAYIRTDRKAFLAPMLQTLLLKSYGSPNEVWPQLFQVVINNVMQKHVLFYMFDEEAQAAAEKVNIAGRIQEFDGDYFHVNDSNFGGAKSNLFITEEVEQDINVLDNGMVEKTVTVTYKNPAKASNCNLEAGQLCLNGTYRNWVRFYLPKGTEVTETLGLQEGSVQTSEDLGKTVVEGFFTFPPESQAKIKLSYKFPYTPQDTYKLMIQKQPGKKFQNYTVTFNQVDQQKFELKTDKTISFEL